VSNAYVSFHDWEFCILTYRVCHVHSSKKQGAYGKIVTHKESIASQLTHIDEVWAALSYLYISPLPSNLVINDPDVAFCEEILVAVSRSFAAVIRQLPAVMLKDVAIFYLVLRALDTVEDDMTAFPTNAIKIQHLLHFHETALGDPTWRMDGVGQGDERRLLQEFPAVHRVFASLEPHSQEVIKDITHRMATGMAEFIGKDLGQGTADILEYNRYCHFVAGLVGEGLSRLFALSKLEDDSLAADFHLSDQMGLFLQKTNIIRDFLEDYVDQRAFWPQSVWKKYSGTGDLGYFCDVEKDPQVQRAALQCLNELVADALELVPDCLAYMSTLQCSEVFRFCAIPQVMAVATLEKCYNNPNVFTGVVKIRKGLSCQLIQRSNSVAELHETFYSFVERIQSRCQRETVAAENAIVYARTLKACATALDLTRAKALSQRRARRTRQVIALLLLGAIASALCLFWLDVSPAAMITVEGQWFVLVMRAALIAMVFSWLGRFVGPWTAVRSKNTLKTADLLMGRTVV
jgi:farnesyl-diphosphate farnesyltransferase